MDRGSLYQLCNIIDRRNEPPACKSNVNSSEEFFELAVTGQVIAATMKLLNMTTIADVPSSSLLSPQILGWRVTTEEKKC